MRAPEARDRRTAVGIRIGGYFIETNFSSYDVLASILLAVLWFLAIFAFRMGLALLELLPELGSLPPDFELSPQLELLTFFPVLTSLLLAIIMGPITHAVISRATLIRIYYEAEVEEPTAEQAGPGVEEQE